MVNFIPKILAIDNNNDYLISLKAIINDRFPGAVVLTSLNSKKGIELAIANNPDVILLDIMMHDMDGFEVCRLLKLDERVNAIPVVFLTSLKGDKENRIKALEVGAEGFISKPIDEPELIAQIRAMIKIKAANEQKYNEKERLEVLIAERTHELEIELTERKLAEEAVRKTKNHFSALIDKAPDGVVLISAEGRFLYASPAALKLFGFSGDEYLSSNPNDLTFPEDLPYVLSELEKLLHNPSYSPTIQYRFASKDGSWRWIESTFSNMLSNPDIQAIVINFRDIHERKLTSELLKKSEEQLRGIFENLQDAYFQADMSGKFTIVSPSAIRMYGFESPDEIIGQPAELLYADPRERTSLISALRVKGRIEDYVCQGRKKDGTVFWASMNIQLLRSSDGHVSGTEGVVRDISERIKVEKALSESEEKYRIMVELLPDAVIIHESGKFVFANAAALRTVGADSFEQLIQRPLLDYVHNDYRTNALNRIKEIYSTGQPSKFSEEKFITLKNEEIDVEVIGIPILYMGKPAIQTIIRDITNRKRAEGKVQESYNLFNKLAAQVPGVVYQYRLYPDGHSAFPYSSPGMFDIYEVTSEEVKIDASPVFSRIHQDDYQYIADTITESAQNLTLYHSEFRVILPKQGLRWRMCDAKPELMDDGSTLWHGIITDITERKLAEQRLKESQQLFQELFNASPDSILLIDPHDPAIPWSIVDCNDAACKMNGYLREEMIGQSIDFIHIMVSTSEARDSYLKTLKEKGILHTESLHRHKKGYIFPIEVSTSVVNIGGRELVLGIDRDISDRKKLETEILAAKVKAEKNEQEIILKNNELMGRNKFIQTVLDRLPIGIALNKIDEGSATYMNKKFEEIYGWTSGEITSIASFFEHVYPDADYRNKLMEQIMNDVQTGDPERMHWENIFATRKDGSKRVINAVNIPLLDQNTMVSTVSDITDLHKSQNDLLAAKEKAEESDRLKSAFLANMSHEIRTPLNSIIGFSELLTDPDFDADRQAEFAQMIHSSGTNLLAIISDIMDLSKIEAGQIQVNNSRFIVNQLISDIQREYSYKAYEKGIELRLDPASPLVETFLVSDQNRIKQVLVNFIGNSIKFTSKGYIEIGFAIFDGFIQFHVIDTGIGIPKNFHQYIFERFGQVDSSSTRKYGGNGLGLAISKSLVEMLGGRIWMESEPGKGSAFYFTIPV